MKKLNHRFNILMIFVLCAIFISCRTTNKADYAEKAESVMISANQNSGASVPIEGIPILAWYGVQEHTIERYRELKECGIDHNLTLYMNVEQISQALDMANEAGVRMIIYFEGIDNELENTIKRFIYHPALAGYFIRDEPSGNEFPHLSELVQRIQAIDNQHFCYINLFGGETQEYRTSYIKQFLDTVPVQFLSFDHYPIREFDGVRSMYSWWYKNLGIISDETREAGKPFWAFALTTTLPLGYPIPTLADLRLQVYSNLAYGAQGIQYYTYWQVPGEHMAPITLTGEKTATWYIVQQMNREIKGLSNIFLGAQVIKVEHIVINASGENGDVPDETTRFDFANLPIEAKKIIKKFIIPNNTNALVSFLKNGNRCYMVIINRNFEGGDNLTFTITGSAGLQLIKKDGKTVSAALKSSKQTITPGDALIYGWDIK